MKIIIYNKKDEEQIIDINFWSVMKAYILAGLAWTGIFLLAFTLLGALLMMIEGG